MPPLVGLLDGPNLVVRSYHAAKLMGGHGPVFLFINALSRILREQAPTHFLIAWDHGSAARRAIYPQYKANRVGSESGLNGIGHDYVRDSLDFARLAGLPLYFEEGYEADDVIAAAHARHRARGDDVIIFSSDKDLLQLLDARTTQIRFSAGNAETDRWDAARFTEAHGYSPEHIVAMMALTGDPGDNVPGMRGVGPVKALKMLQAADWDLERAMEPHPDSRAVVALSRALVDLSAIPFELPCDVPVLAPTGPGSERWPELIKFCERRQMYTVIKRLESGSLWP